MTIVTIDRSRPFNPAEFIGPGWTTEEQDEGSLLLTEIDLTKVRLETCLNSGEQYIKGEEKLRRLKLAGHIRLDAKVFQTLWENQELVPESCLTTVRQARYALQPLHILSTNRSRNTVPLSGFPLYQICPVSRSPKHYDKAGH